MEKYPVCSPGGTAAGLHVGKMGAASRSGCPGAMLSSTQLECA
jgi:hypothetical protein